MVNVGGRLYAIDPAIYQPLKESLDTQPVFSLSQLQTRIAAVRAATQTLPALGIQMKNIPLSQYRKRYTYLTTDTPIRATGERVAFDYGYTIGGLVSTPLIDATIEYFRPFYPMSFIGTPQFINVVSNTGCQLGNLRIRDLYPGGDADRFGTPLLSLANLTAFRIGALLPFVPMLIYLSPASDRATGGIFPARTGLLLGFDTRFPVGSDLAALMLTNSELIFVPVTTLLDQVTYVNYPPGMGLQLKKTNGRNLSPTFFDQMVARSAVGNRNTKGVFFTPPPYLF